MVSLNGFIVSDGSDFIETIELQCILIVETTPIENFRTSGLGQSLAKYYAKRLDSMVLANVAGNRLLLCFAADPRELTTVCNGLKACQETWKFDSLICVHERTSRILEMQVHEKDGSTSKLCENGAIAVGCFLGAEQGVLELLVSNKTLSVGTEAGFGFVDFPKNWDHLNAKASNDVQEYSIVGEPHVVMIVDDAHGIGQNEFRELANRFPSRNTTIASKHGDYLIHARTYERGVNAETGACGTGALAACYALSMMSGQSAKKQITVEMSGGALFVNCNLDFDRLSAVCRLQKVLTE